MRKLLFITLLFACMNINAQENKTGQYEYYCMFRLSSEPSYRKESILQMGDGNYYTILESENKTKEFKSHIEIVNYMVKKGWTYVESTSTNSHYTIMKKIVNNDEEASDNLNLAKWPFKPSKKKKD